MVTNIRHNPPTDPGDAYKTRSYLSAIESAGFLGISVSELHRMTKTGEVPARRSAGGQYRYRLSDLQSLQCGQPPERQLSAKASPPAPKPDPQAVRGDEFACGPTVQKIICGNSMRMDVLEDQSVHLIVTSPPYFNAKMYSANNIENDLGNIHDLDEWFENIKCVWQECLRVLQPGRKIFVNIMNLPIRYDKTFRCLNLAGKTIDLMESVGFIFKRDIIWHKTNGVRAHFGTYPYPGGILINNMHEFILEFDKPAASGTRKYGHLSAEQKEQSKLDKEFWLSLKNSDIWLMKPQQSGDGRSHVAPFPSELPYRLIKAYSYVSETVLDPFAGSCTGLLAAADLRRNGIGYEINPEILKAATERFKNYQMKLVNHDGS